MKIGENIKHLRKENNMLQKDLADKLNVTKGAVLKGQNDALKKRKR